MPVRLKKMLGSLSICVFLLAWIVAGVSLSGFVPDNRIAELVFYAVMGICWIFPVMPVLKWMETSRRQGAD